MSLLIRDAYDYDTASFKNNIKVQYCKTCFKILRLLSGITDGVQVQFRSTLFLRTRRLHMYYRREQASSAPSHPRAQHLPQLTKARDTCTTRHTLCQPTFIPFCRRQASIQVHIRPRCHHR